MERKRVINIWLKISALVLISMIIFGTVHAKVNENYMSIDVPVSSNMLGNILADNLLIQPIGGLLMFFAGVVEWLLGMVSGMLQGPAVMPWVDSILFNAVPLLDINFMNPSKGSIVGLTGINKTIQGVYYTILALTIAFFSISVFLMAIKIAISSLAAEKAKYKQAIVSWLVALLLVFTSHYLISFMFYANESMVRVAAGVLSENTKDLDNITSEDEILKKLNESTLVDVKLFNIFSINKIDIGQAANLKSFVTENYMILQELDTFSIHNSDAYKLLIALTNDAKKRPISEAFKLIAGNLNLSNSDSNGINLLILVDSIKKATSEDLSNLEKARDLSGNQKEKRYEAIRTFMKGNSEGTGNSSDIYGHDELATAAINQLIMLIQRYSVNFQNITERPGEIKMPITALATTLRNNSYTDSDNGGFVKDKISIVDSIVYVMFVVMSLLYFITYIKRLFFVIMLAMLAPIIVVYDFVSSVGKANAKIFEKWLKEFIALVFVQTIQAFIFAIVISFVLNLYQVRQAGSTPALGIITIIVMASIAKIEDLVKNIFGIKSSVSDSSMQGGAKSFVTGMAAMGAAKRIFDNPKKMAMGAKNLFDSKKENLSAMQERNKALKRRFGTSSITENSDGTISGLGENPGSEITTDSLSGGLPSQSSGGISNKTSNALKSDIAVNSNLNKQTPKYDYKDLDAYEKIQERYNTKIKAAKDKKSQGIKGISTGIIETGASFSGAVIGAAASAPTGELSTIAKSMSFTASGADKVAESLVNTSFAAKTIGDSSKYLIETRGQIKQAKKEYDNQKKQLDKAFKNSGISIDGL